MWARRLQQSDDKEYQNKYETITMIQDSLKKKP